MTKIAIILAMLLVSACSSPSKESPDASPSTSMPDDDGFKRVINNLFLDPASVQFSDVSDGQTAFAGTSDSRLICGQLNGKNNLGAYVGFKIFMYEKGSDQLTLEPPADEIEASRDFFHAVMSKCSNKADLYSASVTRSLHRADQIIAASKDQK